MEKCRETTVHGTEQLFWMVLAIIALAAWLVYEFQLRAAGRGSYTTFIYIACMAGLLVWRCAVRYTCILTDREIIIESMLFGYTRQFSLPLDQVESYSNRYIKQFFRKTKISRYVYRYSSIDYRPTRIVVFNRQGKLNGLLLKVSDRFIAQLQEALPDRFLDLNMETKKR